MKKTVRGILSITMALSLALGTACAKPGESVIGNTKITIDNEFAAMSNDLVDKPMPSGKRVSLPNGLRAVCVSPETDFTDNAASVCEDIQALGMNAVIIQSTSGGNVHFDLDLNKADTISNAIDAAHETNLRAYVTLDVNTLLKSVIEQGGGLKSGFSAAAHKFVIKYGCEGILVSNYYTEDSPEMYAEYLRSGSGIGYENWLYETNQYVLRTISDVIRKTSNTTAVGLLVEDMWANSTSNNEGSNTADPIQSLYDGHCDTKKYIENGYADFIMVKAYGSTTDSALNFENVVSWWKELAGDNKLKLYVCHLNERIGEYDGWYEDQLLQQLAVMKELGGCIDGSAFNSYSSLMANPLSSTDTLKKFYADEINTETLFEELKMTSPSQLSFVTYDPIVKFMGTFDENFDVYFDGEKIVLNDVGNFFIRKDLSVGMNHFDIEHKGKKYSYSIEREIDVLKSAYEVGYITVEGGTTLAFTAVAYSGANVYVSVGGDTIELTEKGTSELIDANGSYSEFFGYYTVGAGLVGEEQYLGEISYYATYGGSDESMWGGSVTVAAQPELPDKDFDVVIIPDKEQANLGTGEVVGTMEPYYDDDEYVTYVKVLNNFTDVLDPMTTGTIPSPEFSQMPAGTLDYYRSSSDNYIITTSGKRYRREYVTMFEDTGLGHNSLTVNSIGDSSGKSFINLSLDYKSSFNVNTSQTYVQGYEGPFGVTEFNAKYVYVTFDNVTSVTKLPDFSSCTLFSAGEWSTVTVDGIPRFRLKLTLRQAGIYSGMDAYYNGNGELMLTFNIPTATLSGKTIVISPGHGVDGNSFDPGAIGQVTEQEINLAVAKKLVTELENLGATAVRLKTESEDIYDRDRPKVAREYDADMFIELHCNSAGSQSAHGCEVYYFTPWSQPLAKSINRNLSSFYSSVYADGTD